MDSVNYLAKEKLAKPWVGSWQYLGENNLTTLQIFQFDASAVSRILLTSSLKIYQTLLHTYLRVPEIESVKIEGFQGVGYVDQVSR